jgi:hypothetical protein
MRGYGYVDAAAIGIPTIDIYCREESHAETPFDFPTFGKLDGEWMPLPPSMQPKRLRSPDDFMAAIDTQTGKRVKLPADSAVELSYSLECGECGLRVRMRAENVHVICETLFAAGESSIPLSGLAAILRRRMPR